MMLKMIRNKTIKLIFVLLMLVLAVSVSAQVQSTDRRDIRIGSLQSMVSAYGSERAWNNIYYEGLKWPALYPYQDNAVIQRAWIACKDFTDEGGKSWSHYGFPLTAGYVSVALFPTKLYQTAKFEMPTVYVDGNNITSPYVADVDSINPDQVPDRVVTNVVHSLMGLTMTRRYIAFSQQYHQNYFIREYTFTNTGNTDYDEDAELNGTLYGVRISWGIRYSVCREGSNNIDGPQSWGQHSWATIRGEDYEQHATETITEADPIKQWIRCGFSWAGQAAKNAFDNLGGPEIRKAGRLTAPQFAGLAVLHVDKGPGDHSDDVNQPAVMGWHAGDTYPSVVDVSINQAAKMTELYAMMSGLPYNGLGGNWERFDEKYMALKPDPWLVHNDGGGTNVWVAYGPYDLAPGESIRIIEAEGVSGLNRQMCELVGKNWKKGYDNSSYQGPYTMPDGSTTSNKDTYKNAWFYTGKDSILMTFSRAKRNFDSDYQIPQPPLPPPLVEIKSGGDKITLTWTPSPSESDADFGGYKVFRAIGKPDTTYEMIFACGKNTDNPQIANLFEDRSAERQQAYYYYVSAFNDGSNNTGNLANPTGELQSSMFYTRTTEPAYLLRQAGSSLSRIRVVPNPYNVTAQKLQYVNQPQKLAFLDVPAYCSIKIFTESGELIRTLDHTDGSGDQSWDLLTTSRQTVVSGVYIAVIEVTKDWYDPQSSQLLYKSGEQAIRKFVIIR